MKKHKETYIKKKCKIITKYKEGLIVLIIYQIDIWNDMSKMP